MSKQRDVNNLREGARIWHLDTNLSDKGERVEGHVQSVLSSQFTYVNETGEVRFCQYDHEWGYCEST